MCTTCACSTDTTSSLTIDAAAAAGLTTREYALEGVTCGGCAKRVTEAILALGGDVNAHVDVAQATLTVSGKEADDAAVRKAVLAAGYGIAGRSTQAKPRTESITISPA